MQIITLDNTEFPDLLNEFRGGRVVGRYWRNGTVQIVRATSQFVLISHGESPSKLAFKPIRSMQEAESYALRILSRELARGSEIEVSAEYAQLPEAPKLPS